MVVYRRLIVVVITENGDHIFRKLLHKRKFWMRKLADKYSALCTSTNLLRLVVYGALLFTTLFASSHHQV